MKTNVNVFLLDDEFPRSAEFRQSGVYNTAISSENLFHLAIHNDWGHLIDLQQLIKDIVSSQSSKEGLINLIGFSSPTQALKAINDGHKPDIIIYDWEYPNAPMTSPNAGAWLLEMLKNTEAFVFVYSKMKSHLPAFLNTDELAAFSKRFQLLEKGGKTKSSFSAEEFIFQYIIGSATDSGNIKIDGIPISFTSNNYLENASDILFLQRILGRQYVLDEMTKIDFTINEASVEKILNDSERFLYINKQKGYLITPDNKLLEGRQLDFLEQITYLDVLKKFSPSILEETLERGIVYI